MTGPPRIVWMPGGVRTEIHLDTSDTAGAFCLLVDEPPAGWSLPAHRHRDYSETIHLIDGELELTVDGRRSRVSPGQSIHVPRGVIHTTRNVGRKSARRLVIFSPGGMEQFFLEAGTASADAGVDRSAALASALRHGWEFV